ncbi:CotH kinase family protein [Geomicrobium sp. JCM 19039]|uniref:CotH kinase family protein n=1 Tax=Geomicrobium sp. JCM 19039 TaxID=1460636 RepID=UPI00045F40A8|nr:CotH kinase family protein [Geomicrobium sp. JCM 19039]GAK13930.1 inner spore coat protein H [Geomicrobium sp. JCM 19039]
MKKRAMWLTASSVVLLAACTSGGVSESEELPEEEETIEEVPEETFTGRTEVEEHILAQDIQPLYIHMGNEDVEELYERDPDDDDRLPAYVKLHPESNDLLQLDGGLRFRGNSTRYVDKKSFNVRFEDDQPFLFGSNRLNLNANYSDSSMMRDQLSFELFRDLGLPAPRTEYLNLFINDHYEGLYTHVERIDSDLLEANGLNGDGTLIRDRIREHEDHELNSTFAYNLHNVEDNATFLEDVFDYRGDPNWDAVAELITWVHDTPAGAEFAAKFYEEMNADQVIDWLALHFIVGDMDAFGDDYWWYLDDEDPNATWTFIPWDKDLTFGSHSRTEVGTLNNYYRYDYGLTSGWDNVLIEKMLETPEIVEHFEQRLLELMDHFDEADMNERIDRYEARSSASVQTNPAEPGGFVLHPQNHFTDISDYEAQIEAVREFIPLRYENIQYQLGLLDDTSTRDVVRAVEADENGDIYFTNANGFVIGKIDVEQVHNPGEIRISISDDNQEINGVQRAYTIDLGETDLDGELSLYYQNTNNDLNWYKNEDDIGDQWDLQIKQLDGSDWTAIETENNPYTNRVTTPLNVDQQATFIIEQP